MAECFQAAHPSTLLQSSPLRPVPCCSVMSCPFPYCAVAPHPLWADGVGRLRSSEQRCWSSSNRPVPREQALENHRRSTHCYTDELQAPPPITAPASSSTIRSVHSSKQQGDIVLKTYVASVCFKCFICFRGMLQLFYGDVAKVDQDVAHVWMGVHVYCKLLFPMFHLFFMLQMCLFEYCICFTHMLQVFYLDVAYVL
jgi:hypothetical protein